MESAQDDSPEKTQLEKRMLKLRRSCELCRASKARCCPSSEENQCQKCLKEGKSCIFLEAKPRPKRGKNSRTRVAEMEQKLDSLYALLATRTEDAKETTPFPIIDVPESFPFDTLPPYHSAPSTTAHSRMNQQFPVFSMPFFVFDDVQDNISKGVVSIEQAEDFLQDFRSKACNFPFVVIPPHTSLATLRREKPFLLLSILAFGAQRLPNLQTILELEMRETISRKVFVEGEKSLDLLQGLLVYLVWYHFYFHPGRQQLYQLSQMAGVLAIDLGLNKAARDHAAHLNSGLSMLSSRPGGMEGIRTFLGSYYMSTYISLALRKARTLSHDQYIEDCTKLISNAGDADSDYLITYFVRLQKFSEDVHQAFGYEKGFFQSDIDPVRIEILSKSFRQQLTDMEMTFPPHVWGNATITLSYYTNKVYLNEVGLYGNKPSQFDLASGQPWAQSWYDSAARNNSLVSCLQSAKEYLDCLLSLPAEGFLSFTMFDFIRLIYVVLVLGRFSGGCDSPSLDSGVMARSTNLGNYLSQLITMIEPMIGEGEEKIYYIWHVSRLFKASKLWLDHVSADLSSTGCTHFWLSFMDILPTVMGSRLELSTTKYGVCGNLEIEYRPSIPVDHVPSITSVDPSLVMIGGNHA